MQSKSWEKRIQWAKGGGRFFTNGVGRQGFPRRWDLEQGPWEETSKWCWWSRCHCPGLGGRGSGRWSRAEMPGRCCVVENLQALARTLDFTLEEDGGLWAERWSNVIGCLIGSLCVTNRLQGKRRNWQFQPSSCQMTRLRWGWRQRGAKGCWTYSKAKTLGIFFRFQVEEEPEASRMTPGKLGLSLFQRFRSREIRW